MNEHKRTGYGKFGKGYYIALILCASAIGITGYLYSRNANNKTDTPAVNPTQDTLSAIVEQEDDIAVIATAPKGETSLPSTEATQPDGARKGLKTAAPVSGSTVAGYSMEALSYNQTTRDWRVHNGMDIAAEAGTPVLAAADGEVIAVTEDDTMGTTVEISHIGGYTTRYSSLSSDVSVSEGDMVTLGQTIGTVGSTALVESAMGPHLHFSAAFQDRPMDPAEFLSMGE